MDTCDSGSTVSNNEIGVWIRQGGTDPQGKDYGIVLMDCSNLINNTYGIKGFDVLLQIDAPISSGTFPGKVSPNTFMVGGAGNRLFDICYLKRFDMQTVFARGNFWDPIPQPVHWRLFNMGGGAQQCSSESSNVELIYQPFLDEQALLARYCPKDPIFDPDYEEEPEDTDGEELLSDIEEFYSCVMTSDATNIAIHEIFAEAMQDWYYVDTLSGLVGFVMLASIPDALRDTLDDICRHYIDMARIFAPRDVVPLMIPMQQGTYFSDHGALGVTTTTTELRLVPNPAGSEVAVYWPGAGGLIRVFIYDMYGRQVRQLDTAHGQAINLFDLSAGTWILDIQDPATGDRQTERLIILR